MLSLDSFLPRRFGNPCPALAQLLLEPVAGFA